MKAGEYNDWGITALFYSALHYVEAALARLNIHSEDHGDRTVNIAHYLRYINTDYGVLRNLSQDVRYDLLQAGPTEISEARRTFSQIKKLLENRSAL